MAVGCEEGDVCGREGCEGVIKLQKSQNCSCHLSAPCSSCMDVRLFCPDCDWVDEGLDQPEPTQSSAEIWKLYEPRPLDPTRIDWRDKSHSSCSMIKEGVYPEGTTREEVLAKVNGTFGGRFEHFGGGQFRFIAYTD